MTHPKSTFFGSKQIFKLAIVGSAKSGKSALVERFINNVFTSFYKATVGTEFATRDIEDQSRKIKLQIWDTSGEMRFRSLVLTYCVGAGAILFCLDLTEQSSLDDLNQWIPNIKKQVPNAVLILVGTKADCEARKVSEAAVLEFKQRHELAYYIEVSAKEGTNVNKLFFDTKDLLCGNLPGADIGNAVDTQKAARINQPEVRCAVM